MSTLNHITYNISMLAGVDEDTAYINRVEQAVIYTRALLIRREVPLHSSIASQFSSPLGCLDMIEVDSAQCFGVDLPCNLIRTKIRIPAPIRLSGGNAFLFVGTVDGITKYSEMQMENLRFLNAGTFSNGLPRFIFWDGYIYGVNAKPAKIKINYIVEDPRKLEDFIDCSGQPLYTEDSEFPLSEDMVQRVTQSIVNGEVRVDRPEDLGEIKQEQEDEQIQR